jgi:deoxyribodipyrimidine photolyase
VHDITLYVNEDVHIDFYKQIKKITSTGVTVKIFKDALTVERETKSDQGNYYSVFTPFKKKVWNEFMNSEVKPPAALESVQYLAPDDIIKIQTLGRTIEPTEKACRGVFSKNRLFTVGTHHIDLESIYHYSDISFPYSTEREALAMFDAYVAAGNMDQYKENRDSLEKDTENQHIEEVVLSGKTSKMSLALAWGLVSPRVLKQRVCKHFGDTFPDPYASSSSEGTLSFLSELIWREFYKYLYFHNPKLSDMEFQEKFRGTIAWVKDDIAYIRFIAWIKGETGYPIVDAAMKQLAQTGWMHNRSRMIVASILTKNLGVDWRWGQEYFRAVLIDLDEASNNGGWQWGASVGADPKPIRIFNPMLQAKNYDASGAYQKKWLGDAAPPTVLIEHVVARDEALKRYGLSKEVARDY